MSKVGKGTYDNDKSGKRYGIDSIDAIDINAYISYTYWFSVRKSTFSSLDGEKKCIS